METAREFTVNGALRHVPEDGSRSLLDVLRHDLGLKATRLGCGLGQCGACTVLVDGRPVTACNTPADAVGGCEVTSLEGLGTRQAPHRLQQAFIDEQALQCGWCTSGMLMRAAALVRENPQPTEQEVREALSSHLCRCGVHGRVVRAVQRACGV